MKGVTIRTRYQSVDITKPTVLLNVKFTSALYRAREATGIPAIITLLFLQYGIEIVGNTSVLSEGDCR